MVVCPKGNRILYMLTNSLFPKFCHKILCAFFFFLPISLLPPNFSSISYLDTRMQYFCNFSFPAAPNYFPVISCISLRINSRLQLTYYISLVITKFLRHSPYFAAHLTFLPFFYFFMPRYTYRPTTKFSCFLPYYPVNSYISSIITLVKFTN